MPSNDSEVNLDDLTTKYLLYRELLEKKAQIDKQIEALKAEFRAAMGDAHVGKIADEEVFTYRPIDKFAIKQFTADHPNLAKEFTRPVLHDELDVEALKAAHPNVWSHYRVRQFNTKKV